MSTQSGTRPHRSIVRAVFRILLGVMLLLAGFSHLTFNREAFLAQVPTWLPLDGDFVVLASGVVEIILGVALVALGRYRVYVGWIVAAFFVAIFAVGGIYLTPDLKTPAEWVSWFQLLIAAAIFSRRTMPLAAGGSSRSGCWRCATTTSSTCSTIWRSASASPPI